MGRKRYLISCAVLAFTLGACAYPDKINDEHGTGDGPVGKRDDSPKDVINFPDGFANVAHSCDGHGHRVYVTTHTSQAKQLFVIDDPSCGRG